MKHVGITSRLRKLTAALERDIDELGYQGITDSERESATILDALLEAIKAGRTKSLSVAVTDWVDGEKLVPASEFKAGDRVQWQSWDGLTKLGTIDHIRATSDGPLASILGDNGSWYFKPVEHLKPVPREQSAQERQI